MKSRVKFVGGAGAGLPLGAGLPPGAGIVIELSAGARWLGCYPRRTMAVRAEEIVQITFSDARTVSRTLRWKLAGAALSRQRAMGWFSWIGHRRQWAWIWLTPRREVMVIETTRKRPALIAVPVDWLDNKR